VHCRRHDPARGAASDAPRQGPTASGDADL
jgi:hypothetical protein